MVIIEQQIAELEQFVLKAKLPVTVQLDVGTNITDVSKFVVSHPTISRNNPDKPIFEVFLNRLYKLKEIFNS